MAIFQNDPFPGTDYNSYQTWEKVTTPDGQTYYVVPGNAGYVFDPVASNATGRKVFRANPSSAIERQKQEDAAREKALKQQEFNQSPAGQLLPVAGTVGGLWAVNKLAGGASVPPVTPVTDGGTTTQAAAAADGFMSGGTSGAEVYPVGTDASGGTMMSDGSVVSGNSWTTAPEMGSLGQIMSAAAAAKGSYDTFNSFQRGGEGIRGGLTTAGAGFGSLFGGPIGGAVGAVGGNILGYGLQGKGIKNDAALLLTTGGAGLPVVVARRLGVDLFGQSTKQREQNRWKGTNADPALAEKMYGYDYFTGTEGQESRDEKFLTPDAIRVNPDNYNNVEEWDTWSKAEQDEFLTRLLAEGKVSERKGGIYYDDDRAKEIADEIRAKKQAGMNLDTSAQAKAAAEGATSTPMPRGGRRG